MVKYEYAKIQAKCSSQYVEADLNKKSCSSLKTTTAWKGIPYRFKITINQNPRKSDMYCEFSKEAKKIFWMIQTFF